MSGVPPRLSYSPGLDGIRAVAILMVVAAHSGLPIPGFGATGVTVFFTLSGFLITRLLLAEKDRTGTLALGRFYLRRAVRLGPALLLMVVVVTALRWGTEPRALSDAAWAMSYVGNWWSVFGDGMGALEHTWSLAVEEQFYVLAPLALFLPRRHVIIVATGALAACLALNALYPWGDWNLWARGSPFQAPALLIGVLLAFAPMPRIARFTPAITLAALVALTFIGSRTLGEAWHRYADLLTAIATSILIVVAVGGGLLAVRPLPYIGRISYGLYLWHWPMIWMTGGPGWLPIIFAVVAAMASYHLVEQPARRWFLSHQREKARSVRSGYAAL